MISISSHNRIRVRLMIGSDGPPPAAPAATLASVGKAGSSGAGTLDVTPSGVVAGDLLIASVESFLNLQPFTGWTKIGATAGSTGEFFQTWARIATGSGDNFTSSAGDTRFGAAFVVCRITGHGVTDIATDIKQAGAVQTAGVADPPSLDAGSVKNWLWLVAGGAVFTGLGSGIGAVSAGFTLAGTQGSGEGNPVATAIGWKVSEVQTLDPGIFTSESVPGGGGSGNSYSNTLAIPPAP